MLEVLCSALPFAEICQHVSKMNTRAKVVVVDCKCFFEVLYCCFIDFFSLLSHTKVEKCVSFWWTLGRIFDLNLYRLLDRCNSSRVLPQFEMNFAL